MLTALLLFLNWSFVRDDQPRALTQANALALREEVIEISESIGTKDYSKF